MKLKSLLLAFSLLASAASGQTVTINLYAGTLQDANGTAVADGGIFFLVADTASNGFGALTNETVFSSGNLLSSGGDDYIAGIFKVDSSTTGVAGTTLTSLTLDYSSGIFSQGASLQLYWVPTVTSFGATTTAGTAYGAFRTDSAITTGDDVSISWFAPAANASAQSLTFATVSAGGSYGNFEGLADLTVQAAVPEPATTVALLGAIAGVFVILRRRHRRASATLSV